MNTHIGTIYKLTRYPVKSMAGIATESAFLGWHGLQGDRRFAYRRLNHKSDFPWLTASRLPELLLYEPLVDNKGEEPLPTHVRTPEGAILALDSAELQTSIAEKLGGPVELMQLKHGIFDEASVSVIHLATISAIGSAAEQTLDARRFRANIVIEAHRPGDSVPGETPASFMENDWIGRRLVFGSPEEGPMVNLTLRDLRCMMINLDPDTAKQDPRVMKAVVRLNENYAGAYGTVVRTGQLRVGQPVSLIAD